MCSHAAHLTQGPAPGSAQFWEALRKVFSFRQVTAWQFAAVVCSSWLHRCGDECTGVPFLWFFGHVRCCHPLVSLGLSALISPMSPLVRCFGFSIVVHLRIPSSFHVNCCTSFSHCCLCFEQQCFPQALTILSLISLKW